MKFSFCDGRNKGNNVLAVLFAAAVAAIMSVVIVISLGSYNAYAASDYAYELIKYDKEIQVYSSHSYDSRVKLKVNLPRKMSELTFTLPSGNFQLSDVTVENDGVEYEVKNVSGESTITISDPDEFKKGEHVFIISYRISEYSERIENYDLLYCNVLLPKWKTPMGSLNIKMQFPEDFPMDTIQTYAGKFGVQDNTGKVKFVINNRVNTVTVSGERIPQNYAITIKAELPNGYWRGALDHSWAKYLCCALIAAAVLAAFIMWLIGGRDPKTGRAEQRKPLDEINPIEIGYVLEGKFRIRDLSTFILYMGIKGYLSISEFEPKKYLLIKRREPKDEPRYIRSIYNILFFDVYDDRGIELEKLGRRLNAMYKSAALGVSSGFNDPDMAATTPLSSTFRIVSSVVISIAVGMIPVCRSIYDYTDIPVLEALLVAFLELTVLTWGCKLYDNYFEMSRTRYRVLFSIGMFASIGVVGYELYRFAETAGTYIIFVAALFAACVGMLLVMYMHARGKKNAELASRLKSLRSFIYDAKPNDVDALFFEDNDYYYNMMPYACEFSAIEAWAKTFKWLRVMPPDWFSNDIVGHAETNNSSMLTYDIAKDIKLFTSSLEDYYRKTAKYYNTEKKRSRFKGE